MQSLLDYINSLDEAARTNFSARCATSIDYLRQVGYGNRKCGEKLAVAIDRESGGVVPMEQLRPDVDWEYVAKKFSLSTPQPQQ